MSEEKLTFLTEVELPPYCFLSEAVEWVAFGRVPQMDYHSDGSTDKIVDYRFYWRDMPDNFQPNSDYPWFDPLEFESLGVPVDDEYFEAAEKCFNEFVGSLADQIAEYEAKEPSFIEDDDGSSYNIWSKLAEDNRARLQELGPLQKIVNSVEARFVPHREVACAKLFQLLVAGKILSQAIDYDRWEQKADDDEYEMGARFDEVPPESYSLSFDWMGNEVFIGGRRHVALRVKTTEILKHRDLLLQVGKPITVERFGAFYRSGNASRSNLQGRRGRRTVVDWGIIKSRLRQMVLSDELPDGKENCIYELIAFAEKELGKSPSRTSVQRNMSEELNAHYAQS